MGWTAYHVDQVNLKEECEKILDNKSVKMVVSGNVVYAAVKENEKVFGVVILTRKNNREYMNFSYMVIDENLGPAEEKCPESILRILTPTKNKYANEWRKNCHNYNINKAMLRNMAFGEKVTCYGTEFTKTKVGKKTKWLNSENRYLDETYIAHVGYIYKGEMY